MVPQESAKLASVGYYVETLNRIGDPFHDDAEYKAVPIPLAEKIELFQIDTDNVIAIAGINSV